MNTKNQTKTTIDGTEKQKSSNDTAKHDDILNRNRTIYEYGRKQDSKAGSRIWASPPLCVQT